MTFEPSYRPTWASCSCSKTHYYYIHWGKHLHRVILQLL